MDSQAGQPRLLYPLAELSLLPLQTGESKPLTPVPVRQPVLVRDLAFSRLTCFHFLFAPFLEPQPQGPFTQAPPRPKGDPASKVPEISWFCFLFKFIFYFTLCILVFCLHVCL